MKIRKLLVMATAVFMMASCGDNGSEKLGKEFKITKEEAAAKLEKAATEMQKASGIKLTSSDEVKLKEEMKAEYTMGNETMTSASKVDINVKTDFTLELLTNMSGFDGLIEGTFNLGVKAENSYSPEETYTSDTSIDGKVGLYIKDETAYASIDAKLAADGEEETVNEKVSAPLAALLEEIGGLVGDTGVEMDPEATEMIEALVGDIEDALPDPKAYKNGKDVTIVYSISNDDLNNVINEVLDFAAENAGADEESLNQVKEMIKGKITLNKFETKIKIHDESVISQLSYDIDLKVKDILLDGEVTSDYAYASYLSLDLVANGVTELDVLSSDHSIKFPADLGPNWNN